MEVELSCMCVSIVSREAIRLYIVSQEHSREVAR